MLPVKVEFYKQESAGKLRWKCILLDSIFQLAEVKRYNNDYGISVSRVMKFESPEKCLTYMKSLLENRVIPLNTSSIRRIIQNLNSITKKRYTWHRPSLGYEESRQKRIILERLEKSRHEKAMSCIE